MVKLDEYVLDSLMRDLVGHDRRPVCYLVYLWLAAEEQRQKKPVSISYSDLAQSVGVSKSSAQSAVAWFDPPQADFINKGERHRNSELHRADSMESQLAEDRLEHFRGCPEHLRHGRRVPSLPSSMD